MTFALPLWLVLLGCTQEPGADVEVVEVQEQDVPEPPPPAEPPPKPARQGAPVYQVVVRHPAGAVTGFRLWNDGEVERAGGRADAVTWTHSRTISQDKVTLVREELASDAIATLPPTLPAPAAQADDARATWSWTTEDGPRTLATAAYGRVRIPSLERIETVLRGGRVSPEIRSRWSFDLGQGTQDVSIPCDPMQSARLRSLATSLLDPELPDTSSPSQAPVLLRIDWFANQRGWSLQLHKDGTVVRRTPAGEGTTARLDPARVQRVRELLTAQPWDDPPAMCRGH